jgi:hypothetical protein
MGWMVAGEDSFYLGAARTESSQDLLSLFCAHLSYRRRLEDLGNDGIEGHVEPGIASFRVDPPEHVQKIPSGQVAPVLL